MSQLIFSCLNKILIPKDDYFDFCTYGKSEENEGPDLYEDALKINGSFLDVVKLSVEGNSAPKTEEKKRKEKMKGRSTYFVVAILILIAAYLIYSHWFDHNFFKGLHPPDRGS